MVPSLGLFVSATEDELQTAQSRIALSIKSIVVTSWFVFVSVCLNTGTWIFSYKIPKTFCKPSEGTYQCIYKFIHTSLINLDLDWTWFVTQAGCGCCRVRGALLRGAGWQLGAIQWRQRERRWNWLFSELSLCTGPVSEEPTMLQARNTPAVCWKLPRCFMRCHGAWRGICTRIIIWALLHQRQGGNKIQKTQWPQGHSSTSWVICENWCYVWGRSVWKLMGLCSIHEYTLLHIKPLLCSSGHLAGCQSRR